MFFAGYSRNKMPVVEFAGSLAVSPVLRKDALEHFRNHFFFSLAGFTSGLKAAEP